MKDTKKTERAAELKAANEKADAWNKEFPVGTEVAVVQDDGTRKIMVVCASALPDAFPVTGEIVLKAMVEPPTKPGEAARGEDDQEGVPITRIRKRAVETKKLSEALRVYLSDEERLVAGGEVADGIAKISTLESNLDSLKASINSQIKMAKSEVEAKSELVRNGYEVRPVDCELIIDFDTGRVRKVRKDDGATIEDRAIRPDERDREPTLFPEVASTTATPDAKDKPKDDGQPALPLVEGAGKAPQSETPAKDELKAALNVLKETKRASATGLSRRLNVGIRRAVQIMDALQAQGVVGPSKESGGNRDILVDLEAFELN